ncbi:hypothetical protein BJ912DRAFT_1042028 [Pholiota molesta]|nr:hypothetical protein BJ912DRAFT_1042028 [Pholiota molesta]
MPTAPTADNATTARMTNRTTMQTTAGPGHHDDDGGDHVSGGSALSLGPAPYLVFAGPVQSGLLPIFGKTETETGPGQSQDCKRPIKTDIDRFTSVLGGSATDKNRSQPVLVKTG